jgi:oligo-1,6-glucosidase
MEEMDKLIAEATKRDISIVMDLVVNHTSDEHQWFTESKKSIDNPYRDYYIWRKPQADGSEPNDFHSYFGGSGWEFDVNTGEYYFHQFSKKQPDLNWDNPEVQQVVHKMMNWWLDRGIGGFRMDVIDLIGKDIDKQIMTNGPRLHPLLQQMNKATFGDRDVLTVGESWSATPEIAKLYSDPARQELSMVFQFEHITITFDPVEGKWKPRAFDLVEFKQVISKWQIGLADCGWNSLFWNNHDLPRAVSKYGDPGRYRVQSAKMLATALHFLKGSPYIYQGEEIGMTNVQFDRIEDYQDIETLNLYRERITEGSSHEEMMAGIHENGRDNARTPIHWDNSVNAGFSKGKPWLKINPNYTEINVESALSDPDSIFYHYQKLIQMRKDHEVMVYGDYSPLFESHTQVFGYQRCLDNDQVVVINNFTNESVQLELPKSLQGLKGQCLISNYALREEFAEILSLAPYESFALIFKF